MLPPCRAVHSRRTRRAREPVLLCVVCFVHIRRLGDHLLPSCIAGGSPAPRPCPHLAVQVRACACMRTLAHRLCHRAGTAQPPAVAQACCCARHGHTAHPPSADAAHQPGCRERHGRHGRRRHGRQHLQQAASRLCKRQRPLPPLPPRAKNQRITGAVRIFTRAALYTHATRERERSIQASKCAEELLYQAAEGLMGWEKAEARGLELDQAVSENRRQR